MSNPNKSTTVHTSSLRIYIAALLMSFLSTFVFLFVLSAITYYGDFPALVPQIGIYVIYVLSGLLSGFLIGKKQGRQKYLWGLAVGIGYVFTLLIIRFSLGNIHTLELKELLPALAACLLSYTIGGMLS